MLTRLFSETQLRSRLKKWGVTKPSRQRRKKPVQTSKEGSFAQHLETQELGGGNGFLQEATAPNLHDPTRRPALWGSHRRWAPSSLDELQIPSFAHSGSHPTEALMTPSCGGSFACLDDDTLKYMERQPMAILDLQNDGSKQPYHAPGNYKPINDQYGSSLRSELTSPVEVPAYEFLPNLLSASCGSPDSSHFQIETQHQTPPQLSSPITQPATPWGYPTPNPCHDISPTIYPKDSSLPMHTGHVMMMSDDDNHPHTCGGNCLGSRGRPDQIK